MLKQSGFRGGISTRWAGLAGLLVCVGLFVAAPVVGQAASTSSRATATTISVTAGKPSELAFKLSKFSNLKPGTFIFKVKDGGFAFHDFEICSAPTTATAAKNSCVGKMTAVLHPGQTATLTVKITKTGKYEYLCTVPGHAAGGMKGFIGVGVVVKAPVVTATTTTTTKTTTSTASTTTASTTPVTTTTTAGGGGSNPDFCPAGVTIATSGSTDNDQDENGQPSDGDGCV